MKTVKREKLIPLSRFNIKTKKCHSEARDRPDLIQTAPVPGGSLARQKIKIHRTKNSKNLKSNYSSNVALKNPDKQIMSFSRLPVLSFFTSKLSILLTYLYLTSIVSTNLLVAYSHFLSRKESNKLIKQKNGNGKNSLLISHWNLGSKKWVNKRNQIQALVDTDNPDLIFISEANLDELTPPYESLITGYVITLPKTVIRNGRRAWSFSPEKI